MPLAVRALYADVWRDSKEVGCGVGQSGKVQIWVCEYNPPGNVIGERPFRYSDEVNFDRAAGHCSSACIHVYAFRKKWILRRILALSLLLPAVVSLAQDTSQAPDPVSARFEASLQGALPPDPKTMPLYEGAIPNAIVRTGPGEIDNKERDVVD